MAMQGHAVRVSGRIHRSYAVSRVRFNFPDALPGNLSLTLQTDCGVAAFANGSKFYSQHSVVRYQGQSNFRDTPLRKKTLTLKAAFIEAPV